jgi:hypothetical protein
MMIQGARPFPLLMVRGIGPVSVCWVELSNPLAPGGQY